MVELRFLTSMKAFSFIPTMPGYRVSDVRPAMTSGRPAMVEFIRSWKRSSRGSTLYLSASSMKVSCSSFNLAGSVVARSWTQAKSSTVLNSCHWSSA